MAAHKFKPKVQQLEEIKCELDENEIKIESKKKEFPAILRADKNKKQGFPLTAQAALDDLKHARAKSYNAKARSSSLGFHDSSQESRKSISSGQKQSQDDFIPSGFVNKNQVNGRAQAGPIDSKITQQNAIYG